MSPKGKKTRRSGGGGRHGDRGLRIIAMLEAAKGIVVVIAGLGLMALIHRDVQAVVEDVVRHLHINPARHYPRIFLDLAASVTDARLWAMAIGAMAYASVRFIEAYGLWRKRTWAEWFGILSGGLYLPVEAYELLRGFSAVKLSIILVNLVVVGWLVRVRWRNGGQ